MTEPPAALDGIHHVTLTVSDLDRSVAWYTDVLGFTESHRVEVNGMAKAMLTRDGLLLTLTDHRHLADPGPFSERRTGLDHLAFAVADRVALEAWADRLDALGVARDEVTRGRSGDLIAFRDPDNIALEFYTRS